MADGGEELVMFTRSILFSVLFLPTNYVPGEIPVIPVDQIFDATVIPDDMILIDSIIMGDI